MLVSISVLCYNKADITKRFLQMLESTLPKTNVEVILTNNGSTDDTEDLIFHSNLEHKVYMVHGYNIGFPAGHNEALKIATGKYFVVLNNDITFPDEQWLQKLLAPLNDDINIALVGLQGEYSTLRPDGMASISDRLDYIDGACVAGRTDIFRKFGLFSKSLTMFFFEDSDLSLRYRQMGFKIAAVPISHYHMRSSTLKTIEPDYRNRVINRNRTVFKIRWGGYLRNKMFNNNLLVRMFSHGVGDVICMTPVLESLREEHPTANIEVETNCPEIFENNGFVTSVHGVRKSYQKAYDRLIDFTLDYASNKLIAEEAERISGSKLRSKVPQLYLTKMELDEGKKLIRRKDFGDSIIVGCNFQMARYKWQGRNWNLEEAKRLAKMLRDNGFIVVELGKDVPSTGYANVDLIGKTSIRQLFSSVANVDMFVGIDSMVFHVAQAFSRPSFVVFGATEPVSRVVDFATTFPIRLDDLPCIGCYQKKGKPTYNHCIPGTEACMRDLPAELVFNYVSGEINCYLSNIEYLQNFYRQETI